MYFLKRSDGSSSLGFDPIDIELTCVLVLGPSVQFVSESVEGRPPVFISLG